MKKRILILGVVLAVVFSAAAFAKSNVGFYGVGGKIGYVKPDDIDGTLGFGVVADLGKLTDKLSLEGELLYWSKGEKEMGVKASYSEIHIGALTKYFFPQKKGATMFPYAGGGIGFIMQKAKVEYESEWLGDNEKSDSETDLGIHLLAGIRKALSPTMNGFAEIRYTIGGADILGIFVGAVVKMGK